MTFEIPADLNPALVGLAWLRGRWDGTGYREWPCSVICASNSGSGACWSSQVISARGIIIEPICRSSSRNTLRTI